VKRRILFGALSTAALLVATVSGPAAAAETGPWYIWGYPEHPDFPKCAEVTAGSTSNSAIVQQYDCNFRTHQQWTMRQVGSSNFWRIINRKSGKCLNVQGGSTANSARIIQYTCGGSETTNDQWYLRYKLKYDGHDYYQIENRKSGKCLNVPGASSANSVDLIQYTCSSTARNDKWTWAPAGG
jgi:hypothetical protein